MSWLFCKKNSFLSFGERSNWVVVTQTSISPILVPWDFVHCDFYRHEQLCPHSSCFATTDTRNVSPSTLFLSITPGETMCTVSNNVCFVTIEADGGEGGSSFVAETPPTIFKGGKAAHVQGRFPVCPNSALRIMVGGGAITPSRFFVGGTGGTGGGGGGTYFVDPEVPNVSNYSGGGGGASAITTKDKLLIVAAGGGGASFTNNGGNGGILGQPGENGQGSGTGGIGGGQGGQVNGIGGFGYNDATGGAGGGGGVNGGGFSGNGGGKGGGGNNFYGGGGGGGGSIKFFSPGNSGGQGGIQGQTGQAGLGAEGAGNGGMGDCQGGNGGDGGSQSFFLPNAGGGGGGEGFGGGGGADGFLGSGGGGAGYGGGGAGGSNITSGSGGGGSSYASPLATSLPISALSTLTGNGRVMITYDPVSDMCTDTCNRDENEIPPPNHGTATVLYQDLVIPCCDESVILSFDWIAQSFAPLSVPLNGTMAWSDPVVSNVLNQQFRVDIFSSKFQDWFANPPIQPLLYLIGPVAQYPPQCATWKKAKFDLSRFKGQTIRLAFRSTNNAAALLSSVANVMLSFD